MNKQEIRNAVRALKKQLSWPEIEEKSRLLAIRLQALPIYRKAEMIYGYWPINQEVRTLPILERALLDGKRIALPKVVQGEIRFIEMRDLSRISRGFKGIPEPSDDAPEAADRFALVLMPGLAFDPQGHRIGYGGGYYDRFLAREPDHPTVALCYDFQVFPHLETEENDRPVDFVISA